MAQSAPPPTYADRLSYLGFGLSLAILAMVGFRSHQSTLAVYSATLARAQLRQQLFQIIEVASSLKDAEINQTTYMLTGSPDDLSSYFISEKKTLVQMAQLTTHPSPLNPSIHTQLTRLEALTQQKLDQLNQNARHRLPSRATSAQHSKFDQHVAPHPLSEMSQLLEAIRSNQMALLLAKSKQGEEIILENRDTLLFGSVAALLMLAIAAYYSNQNHKQRRRIEEKLRLANSELEGSLRLKSEFLSKMSHEMRTPMNGVLGMASFLMATDQTLEQKEYTETIRNSSANLLAIIDELLTFSALEQSKISLETQEIRLEQVMQSIRDTHTYSAGLKGLRLAVIIAPGTPETLRTDPNKLNQVLFNLIGNAIKFTPFGEVTISIKGTPLIDGGAGLRFDISDTGIGMSPEIMDGMLEAFSQGDNSHARKKGGTGLGLPISDRLIQLMGGILGAESQVGHGSTFWFTLRDWASPTITLPILITSSPVAPNYRILIAEDNEINQRITRKMVEKMGLQVTVVANGREVISELSATPYDLILMDCQMPEMDGYQTAQHIRKSTVGRLKRIPIIALTANSLQEDRERCLESGMNDYVSKPFSSVGLKRAIDRWLGQVLAEESISKAG